ncbi:MAG TPA: right-handed parallel beta-helix repeat-containing protein [Thermoanaerobaculia bacterium]|nr:right-handed parallel beta-helix repeat-containing protein [Thermoanaerobaculia bacterium]
MSSDPNRVSTQSGSDPTDVGRGEGVAISQTSSTGAGLKFINLIVHDTAVGFGLWKEAIDAEVYGCLIYYNGWTAPDRGHGHGVYVQNLTGTKRIADNIIFSNFNHGVHAFGSDAASLSNITIEGNTIFDNGRASDYQRNVLVGGGVVAQNPRLTNNALYYPSTPGQNLNLGYDPYGAGAANPVITGNYIVNGDNQFSPLNTNVTMTGNSFYSIVSAPVPTSFPSNIYSVTARPPTPQVFVRPNQYEAGRGDVTVFNWGSAASVSVNLSGVLSIGASYEIRNAQNFFASPIRSGVYGGGSVSLPMTGLSPATPYGYSTPPATGPLFNAFVVVTVSGATPPSPTATPTPPPPTPTPTARTPTATPTPTPPPGTQTPAPTAGPTGTPTQPPPYPTGTPTQPPPTATPSPTPPTSLSARAKLNVPVAAHVQGVGGLLFVTDLLLENPAALSVEAQLTFYPAGGGSPSQMPLSLAPGQTLRLPDVVAKFGLNNSVGALCLESSYAPSGLRMTSRTYDSFGAGTYGQAVTGRSGESADGPRFVTGLAQMSDFRTNLGAFNTTAQTETFLILLRGSDGAVVGTTETLELAPGGQTQWSLAQRFPDCFGKGMTAEFRPLSGMAPLAYAAVVDNLSGDPTYYSATTPSSLVYLPVVSRVHGVGGTVFTSDVSIANTSDLMETLTVTFLQSDLETASPISSRVSVGPHATYQMDDVLEDLLSLGDAYGSLKIQTSGGATILVSERISTPSPTAPGTVGQQVEPVTPDSFFSRGSLLGIRQDSSFRSNIGLFNPYELGTSAALLLKAEDGRALGSATVSVPAGRYVQKSLPTLFPGVPFPAGEVLSISLTSSQADVFAFVSVIDNVSQDPTFYPGLK